MHDFSDLEPLAKDLPQTKRGHERCLAILLSANELFVKQGYEAVSLDDIVQHAGGSKASIYKYFGNKEGLFKAICDYRSEQFHLDIKSSFEQENEDLKTYLNRILNNFLSHIFRPESISFIRLVLTQTQKNPELALYIHENGAKFIQNLIAQKLAQAHAAGEIYCAEPFLSAMYYFGILRDYEWQIILGVNSDLNVQEVSNYIAYCVDLFLDGHQKVK